MTTITTTEKEIGTFIVTVKKRGKEKSFTTTDETLIDDIALMNGKEDEVHLINFMTFKEVKEHCKHQIKSS